VEIVIQSNVATSRNVARVRSRRKSSARLTMKLALHEQLVGFMILGLAAAYSFLLLT
jgi:hypothetical protein